MRILTALLGVTAMLSIAPAIPAFAKSANAATITRQGGCTGFVPTSDGGIGTPLLGDALQVSNKAGIVTFVCHFDIPEGSEPDRATRSTGILCGTYLGFTTDTRMQASPGGTAVLVCRINPKKSS